MLTICKCFQPSFCLHLCLSVLMSHLPTCSGSCSGLLVSRTPSFLVSWLLHQRPGLSVAAGWSMLHPLWWVSIPAGLETQAYTAATRLVWHGINCFCLFQNNEETHKQAKNIHTVNIIISNHIYLQITTPAKTWGHVRLTGIVAWYLTIQV